MKRSFLIVLIIVGLIQFSTTKSLADSTSSIVNMKFDLSKYDSTKKMQLWVPYPVSSDYQDIKNVYLKGNFSESAVYLNKKYKIPMLYAYWQKGKTSRKMSISFNIIRKEVVNQNKKVKKVLLNKNDFAIWLAPTSLGPINGNVKSLADKITKGKTTIFDKAKSIYNWVCENMYREPETIGCGTGDVGILLKSLGGKCTDIHSVFVSLCRASGVPAREVFGIRLSKKNMENITKWQHCWAEFFLPGSGWYPVDPADVRKLMLKKNINLENKETKKLREYFFGNIDSYRMELAKGRDLLLNPAQKSSPLNTFGYPYGELDGKPLDFYNPNSFKYTFTAFKVTEKGYAVVNRIQLKDMLKQGINFTLFDVGNQKKYSKSHIKGAKSLTFNNLKQLKNKLPESKSKLIVFYCNGENFSEKSKQTALKAIELGYKNVIVFENGI